jgi:hypothetical protein
MAVPLTVSLAFPPATASIFQPLESVLSYLLTMGPAAEPLNLAFMEYESSAKSIRV